MAKPDKKTVSRKIEKGIITYLEKAGSFRGCAIVAKTGSMEAPERLPCIIVHCPQVSRVEDTPYAMYAKDANVTCILYAESGETSEAKYEAYARELECRMEDLTGLQKYFNRPSSGRDYRAVLGVHVHYIDEFQTDADADGTTWEFGVGGTLVVQEHDEH